MWHNDKENINLQYLITAIFTGAEQVTDFTLSSISPLISKRKDMFPFPLALLTDSNFVRWQELDKS